MSNIEDLTNLKFGRLTAVKYIGKDKNNKHKWLCKCECGNEKEVLSCHLKSGAIQSCGCFGKERRRESITKHNLRYTRLYNTWLNMKNRCYNKKNTAYKNYGGRDIKICKEWLNEFMSFYNWSMSNGYNENLTIDRIDVNGDYENSNCRWVDYKIQSKNKRNNHLITYNNTTLCLTDWARKINVNEPALRRWLKRNGDENIGLYINKKSI